MHNHKKRLIYILILFLFAGPPVAFSQALKRDFSPNAVASVRIDNGAEVFVDYHATTDEGEDLYVRESDNFSKSEVVDLATDLIGTPYDGMTCKALIDVFGGEVCSIPPELPEEEVPEDFGDFGNCQSSYGGAAFDNTSILLLNCKGLALAGSNSQFPTTAATFNEYICGGDNIEVYIDWEGSLQHVLGARFYYNQPGRTCSEDPPDYEPPEDPTTDEIYDAIEGAITNQYFISYDSGRPIETPNQFVTTATNITNNYNTYYAAGGGGDPGTGGDPSSLPDNVDTTPPPEPEPVPDQPSEETNQCLENPNALGCMDVGDIPDPIALGELETPVTFTPVVLAGGASCPAPKTASISGQTLTFENAEFCNALSTIHPIIIAICSLIALYVAVGRGK